MMYSKSSSGLLRSNGMRTVFVGRGVEIGKRGVTVLCEVCGKTSCGSSERGLPLSVPRCHAPIRENSPRHRMIDDQKKWAWMVSSHSGERDVDRYTAAPRTLHQN